MWTPENRKLYDRNNSRYPSDVTDEEWELIKPQIAPAKRGGRKREVNEREIVNAIMYVLSTGCQWRALPKDFPPKSTVWHYLDLWSYDGTLDRIHHELYVKCREKGGRQASPTAAIAKDFENLTRIALAFVKLASIRFMLRRLCQTA
jgi:putative transposase